MSFRIAGIVAVAFAAATLAGCAAGNDDSAADALQEALDAVESGDLVLYLNVTVGNQSYHYSSADPTNVPAPPALPPSGDAPLVVAVSLEAKGLPDAGDLEWSLDWGEALAANGTENSTSADANASAVQPSQPPQPPETGTPDDLPASLQHTYADNGQFPLSFVLALAEDKIESVGTTIDVGGANAGGFAPGTVLGTDPFNATGSLPFGPGLGGSCASEGSEEFPWTFNATFNQTPAQVQQILLQLDAAASGAEAALAFVAPNGTVIAEEQGSGGQASLDLSGPFQAGAYVVRVQGCAIAEGDFRIDGEATYVAMATSPP
jgi:hypothetical protein